MHRHTVHTQTRTHTPSAETPKNTVNTLDLKPRNNYRAHALQGLSGKGLCWATNKPQWTLKMGTIRTLFSDHMEAKSSRGKTTRTERVCCLTPLTRDSRKCTVMDSERQKASQWLPGMRLEEGSDRVPGTCEGDTFILWFMVASQM